MSRTISFLLFLFLSAASFSQDLKGVQRSIATNDWKQAKLQVDSYLQDSLHRQEAGAWYYRGKIYTEMSKGFNGNEKLKLQEEALASFRNYQELDSLNTMMELDKNVDLFRIYDASYNEGISFYNKKKFDTAFLFFKNAINTKDYIYSKGFILSGFKFTALDTQLVNLAAMSAWQADRMEEAIHFFEKMAASRLKAKEYRPVYGLLAAHYLLQQDPKGQTYLNLGKQLFPDDNYWTLIGAAGLEKPARAAVYEQYLKADHPTGVLLYAGELAREGGEKNKKLDQLVEKLSSMHKAGQLKTYEKMQFRGLLQMLVNQWSASDPGRADTYSQKLKSL